MTNEQIEFDKKTTFKNLLNLETKIVGLASKLGRGITLSDKEKRQYYDYTEQQMASMAKIKKWVGGMSGLL